MLLLIMACFSVSTFLASEGCQQDATRKKLHDTLYQIIQNNYDELLDKGDPRICNGDYQLPITYTTQQQIVSTLQEEFPEDEHQAYGYFSRYAGIYALEKCVSENIMKLLVIAYKQPYTVEQISELLPQPGQFPLNHDHTKKCTNRLKLPKIEQIQRKSHRGASMQRTVDCVKLPAIKNTSSKS